jgi:hypothetical protein
MRSIAAPVLALTVLCTGCASVTQGTTHNLRIETLTEAGEYVEGADCTLANDQGTTIARSGTSTQVRRSSKDLEISCAAAGHPDARARLVSRANAGLAGNILIGGAVGAVIDHNTGAAYTYPGWVRLVFGQFAVFDRKDEREGMAMAPAGVTLAQGRSIAAPTAGKTAESPVRAKIARGDAFDYRVTDRASGREQVVMLRAERISGNEVSFNNGARVETPDGSVVRLSSALMGEMDQVTPPGGWMLGGRPPSGSWKMKHRSIVSGSGMSYDLDAYVEGEQKIRVAGREMRTLRIGLRGWAENRNPAMTASGTYQATAWLSPELGRIVRFEVKSRSSGSSSARFEIDEVAELVSTGAD